MTTIIIGPSNAGKSTFIERRGLAPVTYAHQLKNQDAPAEGVLHYNLLHHALVLHRARSTEPYWELKQEPLLEKALFSGLIEKAIVIVAPKSELQERAEGRRLIEPTLGNPGDYDSDLWSDLLANVDLFIVYERLFELLADRRIPFEVIYSSAAMPDFLPSDRVLAHHNLRGRYISPPPPHEIEAVLATPGAEYQAVELPHGRVTSAAGYRHLGGSRSRTFELLRGQSMAGRSMLDIGCALGDMLFRAERHGADRLIGLEPNPRRFAAATAIGRLLNSRAELLEVDLASARLAEPFDDVLALNVLHHVSDPRAFIEKAVDLTRHRLVIEYPTLEDPKFRSIRGPIESGRLAHLPIMGVSSKSVDQTYVFTRSAITRMVEDAGSFAFTVLHSPISSREIAVCTRSSARAGC